MTWLLRYVVSNAPTTMSSPLPSVSFRTLDFDRAFLFVRLRILDLEFVGSIAADEVLSVWFASKEYTSPPEYELYKLS